jgi:hypothetical protein
MNARYSVMKKLEAASRTSQFLPFRLGLHCRPISISAIHSCALAEVSVLVTPVFDEGGARILSEHVVDRVSALDGQGGA